MATYKKRGHKPNSKEDRQRAVEEQSTTAEVFKSLDEGANRTEAWVANNQKFIFIIIGAAALIVLGYLGYREFIKEPTEAEAANEMFQAQQYFDAALNASTAQSDSLFNLSLSGGEGKYGFNDIIDKFGSTEAANLATYYAGMAYLRTNQYQEAIAKLEDFESDDEILAPLAKGAIGDAFIQLNQPEEALNYYKKAASIRTNEFTTPRFLFKAATTALTLKKPAKAEEFLKRVQNEFPNSVEAEKVKVYLGQAVAMQK